jgi:adenylosuccinate lyase
VHWGATTQNITQTGDVLVLREAHRRILRLLAGVLIAAADLAERTAGLLAAGRTHGQHAVPITFGFKPAGWIDELDRHVTRLRSAEPRVFTAMTGGAAGTFASLGPAGPAVQDAVAARLGLTPMAVPSRAIADSFAEYVCLLGLLGATGTRIAHEGYELMRANRRRRERWAVPRCRTNATRSCPTTASPSAPSSGRWCPWRWKEWCRTTKTTARTRR